MEDRKLDTLIVETLEQQADRVSMSAELQRQIKQTIRKSQFEEESMMRHISKKKVVLAAAVMCVMMSMAAVAGGKAVGLISSVNPNQPSIVNFADIRRADEAMGSSIKAVEAFSNGLSFQKGFIEKVNQVDEAGTVLGSYPSVTLYYKDGNRGTSMWLTPAGSDDGTAKHAETSVVSYNGINLTLTKDYYRFVPVGYEVSPEEQAAMDAGQLYISFGSDKVENEVYRFLAWDDEIHYQLMVTDSDGVGDEELIQMAKEIIDAK